MNQSHPMTDVLAPKDLGLIDAYWRASNYLTIGQIYLMENPLLREPLKSEHIKPRLLGHWGTSPGQNLVYVHLFHPHGMDETSIVDLFTRERHVVFAFHGYQRAIHQLVHGRPNPERFHVRGFNEEGTTTTPFDMVVRNGMSRYHLCMEALRRIPRLGDRALKLRGLCEVMLARQEAYSRAYLEDMPEIRDWTWTSA